MRIHRTASSENKLRAFSLTTKLIIVNVFLYLVLLLSMGFFGEKIFEWFALTPALIIHGKNLWTFLTSMFMHGSFFHLLANMFSLFFIGNFLEKLIGRKRFFWVYLISGLLGGIFYVGATLIFGGIEIPAVGASGAIFGLLGVLALLVPNSRIYLIVGPLILIVAEVVATPFLPANFSSIFSTIINLLIILQIFAILSLNSNLRKFAIPVELPMWLLPIIAIVPLAIIGLFIALPIGNSAHLGGLIVGLIYGFYLRKKFPRKTAQISRIFR